MRATTTTTTNTLMLRWNVHLAAPDCVYPQVISAPTAEAAAKAYAINNEGSWDVDRIEVGVALDGSYDLVWMTIPTTYR